MFSWIAIIMPMALLVGVDSCSNMLLVVFSLSINVMHSGFP